MNKISYTGYRFPPEIIHQAIWLYLRFTLSLRDVEDLLAERGVAVSYETVRRWVNHFGPMIAADLRKRRLKPHTTWHLDEVYLKIDGRMVYLWRAVDAEGEVLDVLIQSKASTLSPVQPRRFCPRILRLGSTQVCQGGRSGQRFRRSLTDLADEKVSFFDAAILILSPFAGLRPSRSGVALTLNFPNPRQRNLRAACRRVHDVPQEVVDDRLGLRFADTMRLRELCDEFGCVHCGGSFGIHLGRLWHGPADMSLSRY